ncbi:TetR/AcrR family transcriptional regulator [Nocardioides sp. SYSU D00038]|uniref:TetR/AcrR family transcriptional regulator n=1 Tax=Nocardioides sp. SYSU D00038 TaxID=2812554 RepID=UPI0019683D32|nr:TetR/AcrR family transcriptional regulator C-terminal domain-containing protein [Nocardioides sp. SYSU D00038]
MTASPDPAEPAAPEPARPDPALRLLWRHVVAEDEQPRRGPRQRLSVDDVVDAAIAMADAEGLAGVSMRGLAQRLGLAPMSLYTYVPGRNELVALMVDQVLARRELPPLPDGLRARLETVARVHHAEALAHPWLLDVTGIRPWLGPGAADRYEWQLSAVEGVGLDDVEMDQTVALLVGFASSIAHAEHEKRRAERESGQSELAWWEANAEELGRVMSGREYPLAGRVGQAAGEAYQAASDPARELEFGLARIVDGVLALLATRS